MDELNADLPLDGEELLAMAEHIESLPPEHAQWVGRLFQECLRARASEAGLMLSSGEAGGGLNDEAVLAQLALDTAEWLKTLWDVGYMGADSFPSQPRSAFPQISPEDVRKSALFARIRQGKLPLPFPPPTRNGRPWHEVVEGFETTHRVTAKVVRDAHGGAIGADIEACLGWQVVNERVPNQDYIVQHQGKGPLYRLVFEEGGALLCRQPARFICTIREQERGGHRSYTLEWQRSKDEGAQPVPLRAANGMQAEARAAQWVAAQHPEFYGQVAFEVTA